jgi:lipopolysaccharide transport system ATP-binding protein
MSDDVVIRAENLGKKYVIGHETERERYVTLRDALTRTTRGLARSTLALARCHPMVQGDTTEEFWALKDISFEVKQGEVVGIIGRNGAGKSTLLKILSRITAPTKGRVTVRGRVASLLEVGTGFHPELSGRENIFLNGAILGMSRREIRAKFDEIVGFAEVERFLDTPVKRYSSGMYVRLAFAVAAHLEPEILVVDEVLAVGDAEFQRKCLGKMSKVAAGGRTVLFVSHNMPSVQQLCSSGLLLAGGEIVTRGTIEETMASYMRSLERATRQDLNYRKDRQGHGRVKVVEVTLHDERGEQMEAAICGRPLRVRLQYRSEFHGSRHAVDAAFNLRNLAGTLLTCFGNVQTGEVRLPLHQRGYFECFWPKVTLRSGSYTSTVFISIDGTISDWVRDAFQLQVEDGDFFHTGRLVPRDHGEFVFDQRWSSQQSSKAHESASLECPVND